MNAVFDRIKHVVIALGALALFAGGVAVASQWGLPLNALHKRTASNILVIAAESAPILISIALGAFGLGWPVKLLFAPEVQYSKLVQAGTGLAVMLGIDWLLGVLGLLNPWTAWGVCVLGVAIATFQITRYARSQPWQVENWPNPPWPVLLGLPLLGLWLTACACPPGTLWATEAFGYDVMSYHLQLPREWLAAGRITGLGHNVYSYMPNLVEAGYTQIMAMRTGKAGLTQDVYYTAQLFHAATALLAAAAVGCLVHQIVGRMAAVVAAVAMLAVPWVLITGSEAYDEMAALALVGTALVVVFDPVSRRWRGGLLIGFLLAAATLAKLTVGAMVVPGVLILLVTRMNHAISWRSLPPRRGALGVTLAVMIALAVGLSPWLVRNWKWTGNPVFPFATEQLGRGHWSPESAERWQKGPEPIGGRVAGLAWLGERWLVSPGYGAVGGPLRAEPQPGTTTIDITVFDRAWGIPIFWLATAGGTGLLLAWSAGRRMAWAMLLLIGVMIVVWAAFTHQQARFLLPTVLPGAALLGMGVGRLDELTRRGHRLVTPLVIGSLLTLLLFNIFMVFFSQTCIVPDPDRDDSTAAPRGAHRALPTEIINGMKEIDPGMIDSGAWMTPGDHAINHALGPENDKVYVVADAPVLYVIRPMTYNTVFDHDLLGDLIRKYRSDATRITRALRDLGYTHVWVNWGELSRYRASYGYDPDVTEPALRAMIKDGKWGDWSKNLKNRPTSFGLYSLPKQP